MADKVTRKLGANRGATRLWLEGAVLTSAGFPHGARWNVTSNKGMLVIAVSDEGKRKIAGTVARPIIDINSTALLAEVGGSGDTVTIVNAAPGVLYVLRATA